MGLQSGLPVSARQATAYLGVVTDVIVRLSTDSIGNLNPTANDIIALFPDHVLVAPVFSDVPQVSGPPSAAAAPAPAKALAMMVPKRAVSDNGSGLVAIALAKSNLTGSGTFGPFQNVPSFTTALTGTHNDIVWIARSASGPTLTISYINPGVSNSPLSVEVGGASGLRLQARLAGQDQNGLFKAQVVVGPALAVAYADRTLTVTVPVAGSLVTDIATAINNAQSDIVADTTNWSGSINTAQAPVTLTDGRDANPLCESGTMLVSGEYIVFNQSASADLPVRKLYVCIKDVLDKRDTNAHLKWRSIALSSA